MMFDKYWPLISALLCAIMVPFNLLITPVTLLYDIAALAWFIACIANLLLYFKHQLLNLFKWYQEMCRLRDYQTTWFTLRNIRAERLLEIADYQWNIESGKSRELLKLASAVLEEDMPEEYRMCWPWNYKEKSS